jgi:hypothetical protein
MSSLALPTVTRSTGSMNWCRGTGPKGCRLEEIIHGRASKMGRTEDRSWAENTTIAR